MFIWERKGWPRFEWDAAALLTSLADARHRQGQLLGQMKRLGFELELEAELNATVEDVVKSSAIEGERLDLEQVHSSVARRLGLPNAATTPEDRRVEGVVEMMLDATRNHEAPLTEDRLLAWHAALFPAGYSGLHKIEAGRWRTGAMQVVSGREGRQRTHYEAPPAGVVSAEMARFLLWFNDPPALDGLLRSGVAHLWFATIHPFDDGNGRIARAIADLALAQMERTGQRLYSVSAQIHRERARYYEALERTQRGTLEITAWLAWFIGCFGLAIDSAEEECRSVLRRADFWRRVGEEPLSTRQQKVLTRMFDDYQGKLTARRWAALAKCSVDTAQRDLNELLARGLLVRNPGGSKRTSYRIAGLEPEGSDDQGRS